MSSAAIERTPSARNAEWVARLRASEVAMRRAQAAQLALLAESEAAEVAVSTGYGSLPRLVSAALLVSPGEARARVLAAQALGPRRSLTGEELPPLYPTTAVAVEAGQISLGAARTVIDTISQIPASVPPQAEETLAEYAGRFEPRNLAVLGRRLLAHLNPDGPEPPEPKPVPPRSLRLFPDRGGMTRLDGRLDAEGAAVVRTVLDSLNARRPADESGPDTRTAAQRNADALVEACTRLLDAGDLPAGGGQRPHLIVTMGLDQLRAGVGTGTLNYGELIDAATARRLACDAEAIPVVLDGASQPLDVGRAQRVATRAQRVALIARDGGCAFPGCEAPPGRCIAHHIVHWIDGGKTKVTNLVLVCARHHYLLHHTGWEVRIRDRLPEFIPPEYLR